MGAFHLVIVLLVLLGTSHSRLTRFETSKNSLENNNVFDYGDDEDDVVINDIEDDSDEDDVVINDIGDDSDEDDLVINDIGDDSDEDDVVINDIGDDSDEDDVVINDIGDDSDEDDVVINDIGDDSDEDDVVVKDIEGTSQSKLNKFGTPKNSMENNNVFDYGDDEDDVAVKDLVGSFEEDENNLVNDVDNSLPEEDYVTPPKKTVKNPYDSVSEDDDGSQGNSIDNSSY